DPLPPKMADGGFAGVFLFESRRQVPLCQFRIRAFFCQASGYFVLLVRAQQLLQLFQESVIVAQGFDVAVPAELGQNRVADFLQREDGMIAFSHVAIGESGVSVHQPVFASNHDATAGSFRRRATVTKKCVTSSLSWASRCSPFSRRPFEMVRTTRPWLRSRMTATRRRF